MRYPYPKFCFRCFFLGGGGGLRGALRFGSEVVGFNLGAYNNVIRGL